MAKPGKVLGTQTPRLLQHPGNVKGVDGAA
jgi:hypothetical protein